MTAKESSRKYREANREKLRAKGAAYRAANPEKAKERSRKHYEENREELLAKGAARRAANPEKIKECHRKYYEANKEKCKERDRKYYDANKKKIKEYWRKHREANGERLRAEDRVNRARVYQAILQGLGNKCLRCGFSDERALQIDHVNNNGYQHRREYHGPTRAYYKNILENIASGEYQLLCANCNWIKQYEKRDKAIKQ